MFLLLQMVCTNLILVILSIILFVCVCVFVDGIYTCKNFHSGNNLQHILSLYVQQPFGQTLSLHISFSLSLYVYIPIFLILYLYISFISSTSYFSLFILLSFYLYIYIICKSGNFGKKPLCLCLCCCRGYIYM